MSGLARKLRARLSPPAEQQHPGASLAASSSSSWSVPRERAGTLVRPGFEPELYPYLPAHVTVPKEEEPSPSRVSTCRASASRAKRLLSRVATR